MEEWTEEYEKLIYDLKKKREETRVKRMVRDAEYELIKLLSEEIDKSIMKELLNFRNTKIYNNYGRMDRRI